MKNATKHADELKSLLKRLLREERPPEKPVLDPLHALVRGAMSFDVPDGKAEDAMRAIDREFVDLNELRVATDLEIQEMLGQRYPLIERRVAMITQSLNNIFEREHTLSLDRLKTIPKKDARQFLRELPELHPFVDAYVMLIALDAPCMPVDDEMLATLLDHGVIEEGTTLEDAQKFVEHNVKDEECYEAYACLRRASAEAAKGRKKK
jgi:endonuclease III